MQKDIQKPVRIWTGKNTNIWPALSFALVLHAIILLLPVARQTSLSEEHGTAIELQLTTVKPQPPTLSEPLPEPEKAKSATAEEPSIRRAPGSPKSVVEIQADTIPVEAEPPRLTKAPATRVLQRDLEKMNEPEKTRLTSTILARQFISEKSAVDQLFGELLVQAGSELQKEFHFPARQDMLAMLEQPMPDVPFAYTPGLIYFAFDPGVKGDLQRFWDVITPEFGWRTKNGTEVRCVLVLVLVGCGWK